MYQPNTIEPFAATHLALELFPRPNLDPDVLRLFADDVLEAVRRYQRRTGAFCEIEEWGLSALLSGEIPPSPMRRVQQALNNPRRATDVIREPGDDDLQRYSEFYGGCVSAGSVTVLLPLPSSDPERMKPRDFDRMHEVRKFVSQLPIYRMQITYLDIGRADERLGLNATRFPVLRRPKDNPNS